MIDYKGMKLPDGETHLPAWMDTVGEMRDGKPVYQGHKYKAALGFCERRRVAVDVGAHVGLWTRLMALDFERVIAFEPVPAHVECWLANIGSSPNAILHNVALGEHAGTVSLCRRTPDSCGDTGVTQPGEIANAAADVRLERLDSYELPVMDLLKIDNEGYECFVVRGALETIKRCRPVVIVEQKGGMAQRYGLREQQAVEELQAIGMKLVQAIQGDFILRF